MLDPIFILTICSLTIASPWYDCSHTWTIEYYAELDLGDGITCRESGPMEIILGCVKYGDPDIVNIRIGSFQGPDEYGLSVFEHEKRHVLCNCDFHE